MPEYLAPGVFVEEISSRPRSIEGVPTGVAGFVARRRAGSAESQLVTSAAEFDGVFGVRRATLSDAAHAFFANGGRRLWIASTLAALAEVEEISLVAAPGAAVTPRALAAHAARHRRFALVDGPRKATVASLIALRARLASPWAALNHPWVETPGGRLVPPSGFVAGIYARSDAARGVWKAPANQAVHGAARVAAVRDPAGLAAQGVNVIREVRPGAIVLWGARTTSDDPEWKYVNIRRYLTFVEHSIDEGTQWVAFEPNDERLRQTVRDVVTNFLTTQWRAGALLGATPDQAFFVRCDATTTTQADIDAGRLVCLVGCAVVKPAEFVILRFCLAARS